MNRQLGTEFHRRDTCRLCGSRDVELVLGLCPAPPVDAYVPADRLGEPQAAFPLDLFLCLACGHAQLLDVVPPDLLFGDYRYVTTSSPGLVEHFKKYSAVVLDRFAPPLSSLVVEIGSNDGTLLGFFKEAGLRPLGIDPAVEIARKASESGLETLPAYFTSDLAREVRDQQGPAAIVCANNVFAHMDDIGDVADGVRSLLAPDGVFVFEVHYLLDLIDEMVFDFIYHEHLCYHSVKPLDKFLRLHDMELIAVERVPTKGGSIRCFAQPRGGPRPIDNSVDALKAKETACGLDRPEIFLSFRSRIDELKSALHERIVVLEAQGKTIAGYGASATVTVLIHHFDLGEKIEFLVDDNVSKQNLFSPGHHIPVLPPSAIYDRKPDYLLVLAWRFRDMIVRKHQAYLEGGGQFIVPLPEIEVIGQPQASLSDRD